jgi:hypothetical protein
MTTDQLYLALGPVVLAALAWAAYGIARWRHWL